MSLMPSSGMGQKLKIQLLHHTGITLKCQFPLSQNSRGECAGFPAKGRDMLGKLSCLQFIYISRQIFQRLFSIACYPMPIENSGKGCVGSFSCNCPSPYPKSTNGIVVSRVTPSRDNSSFADSSCVGGSSWITGGFCTTGRFGLDIVGGAGRTGGVVGTVIGSSDVVVGSLVSGVSGFCGSVGGAVGGSPSPGFSDSSKGGCGISLAKTNFAPY